MGSTKISQPATVTPQESAASTYQAMLQYEPQAAKLYADIQRDPYYGTKATTQLEESIRRELFPQETQVRDLLTQNVNQALTSPIGLTQQQSEAQNALRGQAQSNLQRALREQAQMGGNLYGGRAANTEANAVRDLNYQFAESDIARDQQNRLNAIQSALPLLQLLYPNVQLTPPQYTSPVASADTSYNNLTSQRNQNLQAAMQQSSNNAAMYSALFSGLGTAAGGALGAPKAGCWVAATVFGGWDKEETIFARFYIRFMSPSWFRNLYMKFGERFAKAISNKDLVKLMIKPLFIIFAKIGKERFNDLIIETDLR